jgi:uncharacterized YigZ family protein
MNTPSAIEVNQIDRYSIPASKFELEEKIQKSRFIASVIPFEKQEELSGIIERFRKQHFKANHNCYAWRIGHPDKEAFHYSDDGEPSGTAGLPIMQAIRGAKLSDVLVVVTRYFGGVKLGTGGLVRAYGGVSRQALETVETLQKIIEHDLELVFDYSFLTQVKRILSSNETRERNSEFAENVKLELSVPLSKLERLRTELTDLFQGQGEISG